MIQRVIRLVVDQVAVGKILDRVAQNKEPNQIGLSGETRREKKIRALDPWQRGEWDVLRFELPDGNIILTPTMIHEILSIHLPVDMEDCRHTFTKVHTTNIIPPYRPNTPSFRWQDRLRNSTILQSCTST